MKKIAQTPFIPDLDLDEGEEFSWDYFDDSDFEEHLGAFSLRVMVPLWSAYVHVIRNHPFAVATIDAKCVRPEDAITKEGLFQYLQSISHYGQDTFFLNYPEVGDIEEELENPLESDPIVVLIIDPPPSFNSSKKQKQAEVTKNHSSLLSI